MSLLNIPAGGSGGVTADGQPASILLDDDGRLLVGLPAESLNADDELLVAFAGGDATRDVVKVETQWEYEWLTATTVDNIKTFVVCGQPVLLGGIWVPATLWTAPTVSVYNHASSASNLVFASGAITTGDTLMPGIAGGILLGNGLVVVLGGTTGQTASALAIFKRVAA